MISKSVDCWQFTHKVTGKNLQTNLQKLKTMCWKFKAYRKYFFFVLIQKPVVLRFLPNIDCFTSWNHKHQRQSAWNNSYKLLGDNLFKTDWIWSLLIYDSHWLIKWPVWLLVSRYEVSTKGQNHQSARFVIFPKFAIYLIMNL